MTPTARRQALLALFGVLVAVAVWRLVPGADEGGFGGPRTRGKALAVTEVSELRVADLEPTPSVHPAGRDPFHYGAPPPPPGPTPEEIEAARRQAQAEAEARARALAAQQASAVPAQPPEPQPPAVPFRYLGSFGSAKRRVAVLSDGNSIYNALEGDVLEGQFIVHRIGLESVDLRFVDFPDVPPRRLAAGG